VHACPRSWPCAWGIRLRLRGAGVQRPDSRSPPSSWIWALFTRGLHPLIFLFSPLHAFFGIFFSKIGIYDPDLAKWGLFWAVAQWEGGVWNWGGPTIGARFSHSGLSLESWSPAQGQDFLFRACSHSHCWTAAIKSQQRASKEKNNSFLAPEGIEGVRMEKLTLRMKKLN
jgi:hypothetical protein